MDGEQVDIMKDLSRLSDGYPFMITVYQLHARGMLWCQDC